MSGSNEKIGMDVQVVEVPSDNKEEQARRRFENNSALWKVRKGFVSVGFYAMATFPRVLVNRYIRKKPLYTEWSTTEETGVRTLKWLLDAPLPTLRANSGTLGFLFETFRCSEPLKKIRGVPGVRGYWFGPEMWKGRKAEATILYLHGGGYVALSALWGTVPLCYLLKTLRKKHNIHARVLSINYPLAPESMYPHAVNCAERAYRWLVESGLPGSQQVFIAGDSAGGGLSLSLLQRIYRSQSKKSNMLQKPLGAILISPWVDLSCASASYRTNAKYDYLPLFSTSVAAEYYVNGQKKAPITIERSNESISEDMKDNGQVLAWLEQVEDSVVSVGLAESAEHENQHKTLPDQKMSQTSKLEMSPEGKLKSSNNRKNPYKNPMVSPLNTPAKVLSWLPPVVISYGGKELFKDDIESFILRLQKAKAENSSSTNSVKVGDIKIIYDEDMVHVYPMLVDLFGTRARYALKEMCKFMSTQLQMSVFTSVKTQTTSFAPSIPYTPNTTSQSMDTSNAIIKTLPLTLPVQNSGQLLLSPATLSSASTQTFPSQCATDEAFNSRQVPSETTAPIVR